MNIDDLKQELSTMTSRVHDTGATARLEGVDHKMRTANRNKTIGVAVAVAAVVAVAGFAAPQLLATSENSTGPADQTVTQRTQQSPTTEPTPTTDATTSPPSTAWTPVGRQTFVDAPDNAEPYVDITRVEVTNGSQALEVVIYAADLKPGAADAGLDLTRTLDADTSEADIPRGIKHDLDLTTLGGEFGARLLNFDRDVITGACPGMTAEQFTDSRSYMRVVVPRTCLEEEPGPFGLYVSLRAPGEGEQPQDWLATSATGPALQPVLVR